MEKSRYRRYTEKTRFDDLFFSSLFSLCVPLCASVLKFFCVKRDLNVPLFLLYPVTYQFLAHHRQKILTLNNEYLFFLGGWVINMKKTFFILFYVFICYSVISDEIKLPDGSTYFGSLKHNLFEGYASQKWTNGDIYIGYFSNGMYNGTGNMSTNTYTFEGRFENGLVNGKGKIEFKTGINYTGDFKNGIYDGKGVMTDSEGNIYTGDFVNGVRSGKGYLFLQNGDSYTGDYQNDMFNGYGIYKELNGNYYVGNFKNNKFNGEGIYITTDGKRYEGVFDDGKFPVKYESFAYRIDLIFILLLISLLVNIFFVIKLREDKI
ncbi:MAG: hypothetical protein Ta2F_17390 [Termitinemataceae bacterium]|nr:MAG: hypothetical protein Ta2F_17390 [Termitinemataceae bacterium]